MILSFYTASLTFIIIEAVNLLYMMERTIEEILELVYKMRNNLPLTEE
jgi:hypothetical protein